MPIDEKMERDYKARSGVALGGIGAGSVELRKDGIFYNWNIFNNVPLGFGPRVPYPNDSMLFFIIRFQEEGKKPMMKLLQIDQGLEVATIPSHYYTFPWLSGVDRIDYCGSFPYSKLEFTDADMPLQVTLEAFSPFIPHDVDNSSLPGAFFNFTVHSKTTKPVDVMLMATLRNAVGYDQPDRTYVSDLSQGRGYKVFQHRCNGLTPDSPTTGTMAMASLSTSSTYYLGWEHRHPYYEICIRSPQLPNIDDTDGRNSRDKETGVTRAGARLFSTIAVSKKLQGKSRIDHTFAMAWHFPNLYCRDGSHIEGHHYATRFGGAQEVAQYLIRNKGRLERGTREFHRDFFDSTVEPFVLDQVNSQLNTFFTSSWYTKGGNFGIQEGMTQARCWGPLATIDVAMYGSISTAALFPKLDQAMMREHAALQSSEGVIRHGIGNDFTTYDRDEGVTGRLDLPSQYVVMALRHYFWTGDRGYLSEIWPSCVKALEYVLEYRDPNGDMLPDMAGSMCTYDNFPMYGAASYVASCWLAALSAAVAAADALGDEEARIRYADILESGETVFREKLWNGSYYRLYNDLGGQRGDMDEGCLTDQVIGQWANHLSGLPGILPTTTVRKALRTVMKMSYDPDYGLTNCTWPEDEWLHDVDENCWSDQANTCWSGVELAFASFLIYEGMYRDGLKVIRNVDDRYRKNGMYWDHQEFGGHYFRPMSAWSILNAALGLTINADRFGFDPKPPGERHKMFFSFGTGTGHFVSSPASGGRRFSVEVSSGKMLVREVSLGLDIEPRKLRIRANGNALPSRDYDSNFACRCLTIRFRRKLSVKAGSNLTVTASF